MPQFEYCPPFAVFDARTSASVTPILETHSLQSALESLRTRPHSTLSLSILVTEGASSTLVPVTFQVSDLEGLNVDDVRKLVELYAERRSKSLPAESLVAASS